MLPSGIVDDFITYIAYNYVTITGSLHPTSCILLEKIKELKEAYGDQIALDTEKLYEKIKTKLTNMRKLTRKLIKPKNAHYSDFNLHYR